MIDTRDMVESVYPIENINHNPWSAHDNIIWELARIGNRSWRERNEVINKTEILKWLDEKRPNIVIATDRSIHDDVTAWGGAVWKEEDSTVILEKLTWYLISLNSLEQQIREIKTHVSI